MCKLWHINTTEPPLSGYLLTSQLSNTDYIESPEAIVSTDLLQIKLLLNGHIQPPFDHPDEGSPIVFYQIY